MSSGQVPLLIDGEHGSRRSEPTLVLAHGAGGPMDSPFMAQAAEALAARGLRVVRFEFPYMRRARQTGRAGRPDSPEELRRAWIEVIAQLGGGTGLVIGGKSMGGRIASMVADGEQAMGLVCLGYPFHPAGRPERLRTAHLRDLRTPCLIVQGTRDSFGSREEITGYTLSKSIEVLFLEDGDHSFKPRKSSGFSAEQHFRRAVEAVADFCFRLAGKQVRAS
jgi:predicted alpha/beta-hydrolase family hydrolase